MKDAIKETISIDANSIYVYIEYVYIKFCDPMASEKNEQTDKKKSDYQLKMFANIFDDKKLISFISNPVKI